MDFKDYVNALNDLDNKEAQVELKNIYILNSSAFNHFKSIDRTIQELLKQPCISPIVVNQLKETIPALLRLKKIITELDSVDFAKGYKTKIYKLVDYINNSMIVDEVNNIEKKLQKLLDDNTKRYNEEQTDRLNQEKKEQEKKTREKHEAEKLKEINRLNEEREKNREFQMLFEYNDIKKTRNIPLKIFIDDLYVATITPKQTFTKTVRRGMHRVKINYYSQKMSWLFKYVSILAGIAMVLYLIGVIASGQCAGEEFELTVLILMGIFLAFGICGMFSMSIKRNKSLDIDINIQEDRKVGLEMHGAELKKGYELKWF